MTITDLPPRLEATAAPESDRVAELRRMLDDPQWAADVDDIRAAIVYLTATTVLGA